MLKKEASCGTKEKSDIYVRMYLAQEELEDIKLTLKSVSMLQFGEHIRDLIKSILKKLGAKNIEVIVEDMGALDFTIKSRVETCYHRLMETEIDWREI